MRAHDLVQVPRRLALGRVVERQAALGVSLARRVGEGVQQRADDAVGGPAGGTRKTRPTLSARL